MCSLKWSLNNDRTDFRTAVFLDGRKCWSGEVLGILRNHSLSLSPPPLLHVSGSGLLPFRFQETRHSSHLSGSLVINSELLFSRENRDRGKPTLLWQILRTFSNLVSLEQPTWYIEALSCRCNLLILKAKSTDTQTEGRPEGLYFLSARQQAGHSVFLVWSSESFLRQMFLFLLYS